MNKTLVQIILVLMVLNLFSIAKSQSITILRPFVGENVPNQPRYAIQYDSPFGSDTYIEYSLNNGIDWVEAVIQGGGGQGSTFWKFWDVPDTFSLECKIRITANSDSTESVISPGRFSVTWVQYDTITVNEVLMWFANNGDGSYDPYRGGGGFSWPGGKEANQSAIFEDGLCWGGLVGEAVRVNGNTHRQGLQPGNIKKDGNPANLDNPQFGIWRVNPKWQSFAESIEKDRLQHDWNNWPVNLGAPWNDVDSDEVYNPEVDNPKISGDELFWMVMNDMDTTASRSTYGADPIGLEIQLAIYAYNTGFLKDVVFKKYKILNKGLNSVDSMFFSYWADPDLGDAGDDFAGFDTLLSMAYCYNSRADDRVFDSPVPAVGFIMLQGPVVPALAQDSAYFNNRWVLGYKNQKITSGFVYIGADPYFDLPALGDIRGAHSFYNNMLGKLGDGLPIIDPKTGLETTFMLAGDPVAKTGWYDGQGWPRGVGTQQPGDRWTALSTGPFDFAPGDSQEVVYAIIMAQGENNLDSITELKRKAAAVREFYYTGKLPTAIKDDEPVLSPNKFSLSQNYPNPFNPETIINYELRIMNEVKLIVYDVLGREVKILVDKTQQAGKYKVTFDAANLASGVYYYKLKAGKNFEQTRKMLLLR
jgi:Secretion system C-terminal sorting domain